MSADLVRMSSVTMGTGPFVLTALPGFDVFVDAVGAPIHVGLQGLDAQGVPVPQRLVGIGQLLVDGRLQIDTVTTGSNGASPVVFACDSIVVVDVMSIAALVDLIVAATREGVDVLPANSFALTFAGRRVQQRDADGAVTITGLAGLSAGAEVSLVIRNKTSPGAAIAVTVVPAVHALNDSPPTFSLPAGKQVRLAFGSVGTVVDDVDYACGVES